MKIVATDNFGRETVAELLIEDGLSKEAAEARCAQLNLNVGDHSPYWHIVKPDDYKLWRGMEELV